MKSKSLIGNFTGLLAALLLTAGVAQAGDDKANNIIDQNLSKRPYHQAPIKPTANKADNWDGATLVKEEAEKAKPGPTNYQQLRIRMLGQRPYMHKSDE